MDKHGWAYLISIVALLTFTQSACTARLPLAEVVHEASLGTGNEPGPQPDLGMPPALPDSIQDAKLMEGWISLYNQVETVLLWDGSTLTGRSLAQFILDHHIPIVWDSEDVCGGASCSLVSCSEAGCTAADSDPIYILPAKMDDFPGLVGILAHEIFHRTEPFGAVRATRYEEYWAYAISAHFSRDGRIRFDGYDPLVPAQLIQWFKDNRIHDYYGLQYYPPGLSGVSKGVQQAANLVDTLTP